MSELESVETAQKAAFPYKMKDLCERTGFSRQAIHFYIQQGLLPQGHKTGRNMAYYGEAHVARLGLIRRLQHERFLPLKAIRALLDEEDGSFSPSQRDFFAEVRGRLGARLFPPEERLLREPVCALLARTGVSQQDFDRLVELGLFGAGEVDGELMIARGDAWIVEIWSEMVKLGFRPENGFSVDDFAIYEESIHGLFQRETVLLRERFAKLDPELAAGMIEKALPHLNAFLTRYHATLVRNFLAGF